MKFEQDVHLEKNDRGFECFYTSDRFQKEAQQGFKLSAGAPLSLSLYGADPIAHTRMGLREAPFYERLAPQADLRVPDAYVALQDENELKGFLLPLYIVCDHLLEGVPAIRRQALLPAIRKLMNYFDVVFRGELAYLVLLQLDRVFLTVLRRVAIVCHSASATGLGWCEPFHTRHAFRVIEHPSNHGG